MTREELKGLDVGQHLQVTVDVEPMTGRLKASPRWSEPRRILEVNRSEEGGRLLAQVRTASSNPQQPPGYGESVFVVREGAEGYRVRNPPSEEDVANHLRAALESIASERLRAWASSKNRSMWAACARRNLLNGQPPERLGAFMTVVGIGA